MWIADELPGRRRRVIGKAHHCMVDGIAIVELGKLLLDARALRGVDRRAPRRGTPRAGALGAASGSCARSPTARPTAPRSCWRRCGSRARPGGCAASPGLARTLSHTLLPPAPGSPLNRAGSPRRHHVRMSRPLDELRTIRRRFGVTPNDVVLAACAGRAAALRRARERLR